eukprot:Skav225372  [mRNA]  locus=scaffold329:102549:105833:- [translate_table: standard]
MIATVYGYPRGPTWPQARRLTEDLVAVLSREVVLGATGPRIICGDFNCTDTDLEAFHFWHRMGWRSAQDFAMEAWGQEKIMTCKGATEPDLIWLSPEALALLVSVQVHDVFMEHSTVSVNLAAPVTACSELVWPLPSGIPWETVDGTWGENASPVWTSSQDPNEVWADWGRSFETALVGHVPHQPFSSLLPAQSGRCQTHAPRVRPVAAPVLKPSRPSEVALRNDLAGSAVKSWFRQLRRIQSYVHAVVAGKQTPDAICYRLELWSSILRARGFRHSFSHWWEHLRTVRTPESPWLLPQGPPPVDVARAIFSCFRQCFDRFERWHLRQRGTLLKARYDKSLGALYQDLKPVKRERLDFLKESTEHVVVSVEPTLLQIHVDPAVPVDRGATWTWDGDKMAVTVLNEYTLQLDDSPCSIEEGHVLTRQVVIADTKDLHNRLLDYWTSTWGAHATIPPAVWANVTGFFSAYMPSLDFSLEPITLPQWKAGLRRFKPSAARGVDGISHLDLLALPDVWSLRLLELLNQIEHGTMEWPTCVLYGVVNLLAKDPFPGPISRYRPVVVFSVIYRAWSSLRARQLLVRLSQFLDCDTYGFVPGCEAAQLWLVLQAEIEQSLQADGSLCGLSTDLVRAFNHVPRQHTFALAEHLGVPSCVLVPWQSFLTNCTRAFMIHGCLSSATKSSCGLPEGDALSVFGMLQLDFAYHVYMRCFCPQVRALSYVDNLSLTAVAVSDLVQGLACLQRFLSLWHLDLDAGKSYCWAVTTAQRKQLSQLPFMAVSQAGELGGSLTFSRRHYVGSFKMRAERLGPRWERLKRSRAPLFQKYMVLSSVFWPAALHGAHGSSQGATLLRDLRTAAVQALGLSKAGANNQLRLTLSGWPSADPGFWRLRMLAFSFRRLAAKEPVLVTGWKSFMTKYDGTMFNGPFSQMLVVFNQIGWHLDPPFFHDHDGLVHNLLQLDGKALSELLLDGWLQHVAAEVGHRQLMHDLQGLDVNLAQPATQQRTGLELALQSALQSGAFFTPNSHSKYDMSKTGDCPCCQEPDDQLHWLRCPLKAHLRPNGFDELLDGSSTALRAPAGIPPLIGLRETSTSAVIALFFN